MINASVRLGRRIGLVSCVFFLAFGAAAVRANPEWAPESVLPPFTFSAKVDSQELAAAERIRGLMLESLRYWKERGLPRPPAIDSLIYVPNYENVRLVDLIQALNPGLGDVKAHVMAQYEHFRKSDLFTMLSILEKEGELPPGFLTNRVFDAYADRRYGFFFVPDFVKHVTNDSYVHDIPVLDLEEDRPVDNAFYSRTLKVDLTDLLPLRSADEDLKTLALFVLEPDGPQMLPVFAHLLGGMKGKIELGRRIVFLPRSTQSGHSLRLSTLNDASVATHELGHHMNATLAEATGGVPRLVDEALADYYASSQSEDPLIGAFFAKASGEIASTLRHSENPSERAEARRMDRTAAKGALRDMRELVCIDGITRKHVVSSAYSAGHPVRAALWRLRQDPGIDSARMDEVALRSVSELSAVPRIVTGEARLRLQARTLMQKLRKQALVEGGVAAYLVKTGRMNSEGKAVVKSGELADIVYRAEEAVDKILGQRERESKARRIARVRDGMKSRRPLVEADYIIAEYFRALHRAAVGLGYEEIALKVEKEAGLAMNATVRRLFLSDGTTEIVFFRDPKDANDTRVLEKLDAIFVARHRMQREVDAIPEDLSGPQLQKVIEPLLTRYDDGLNRLIAFERTGHESRLDDARMHTDKLKKVLLARKGAGSEAVAADDEPDMLHRVQALIAQSARAARPCADALSALASQ